MERVEQVAGPASPEVDDIALAQTARIPHPEPRRQFIAGRIVRAAGHAETHGAFEFDGFEKPGVRPDQRAVDQRKIDARFEEHPHRYGIPYERRRIEQIALAGKLPCRAGRLLPGRLPAPGTEPGISAAGRSCPAAGVCPPAGDGFPVAAASIAAGMATNNSSMMGRQCNIVSGSL